MDDTTITAHIADLAAEVAALGPGDEELRADLTRQIEQSQDLLRQRRLRRANDEDPGLAQVDVSEPS